MKKKSIALIIAAILLLSMFAPYGSLFSTKSYAAVTIPSPALVIYMDTTYLEDGELDVVIGLTGDLKTYGVTYYYKYDTSKLTPAYLKRGVLTPTTEASVWAPITGDWACNYSINNSWLDATTGEARIQTQSGTGFNPHEKIGTGDYEELENKYDGFFPVAICMFQVSEDFTTADLTSSLIQRYGYSPYPSGYDIIYEDGGNKNLQDISTIKYDGISSAVDSIDITTNPTKTSYTAGQTVDLTGGRLKVVYDDSTEETIDLTADGVTIESGSPTVFGTTTVTIGYKGKTDTFDITVTDPVDSIDITTEPTTKTYNQGDAISLNGGVVTATTTSNATTTITLPHESVTSDTTTADINSANRVGNWTTSSTTHLPVATQKVTLTHEGKSDSYNITVNDVATGITLAGQKTAYKYGQALDLTGTVSPTLTSGITTVNSNLSNSEIVTVSGYNPNQLGEQTLTVSAYGKTKNFYATVSDYTNGIDITHAPTKTEYKYGEDLDLTGLTAVTTKASGAAGSDLAVTSAMVSGYNKNSLGTQNVTVSYTTNDSLTGAATTYTDIFTVNVVDTITGFTIKTSPKTAYKYGETLNVVDGVLSVTRGSGNTDMAMTSDLVTGFNPNQLGTQTLTISYGGFTKTYDVNVTDYITGIDVTAPTKVSYKYGEDLDITTASAVTVMKSGAAGDSINITNAMISGYNKNVLGSQTITVKYTTSNTVDGTSKNFTDTFVVEVTDDISGITVVEPNKVSYKYGEDLILTGGTVTVNYASGTNGTPVDLTSDMITGYNKNSLGKQTLTVAYSGKTNTFDVTVNDYVSNVTIVAPTKTAYNHGDTLDLTGGTITETNASGTTNNVTMLASMIKESDDSAVVMNPATFDSSNKVAKTLKITYGGVTKNYPITILNDIRSLTMKDTPKTQYNVNDTLDITNGKVTVNRAVGSSDITLSTGMVTGFSSVVELVNYPLTVSYSENGITKTTSYNINVKDTITGFVISKMPKVTYNYGEELNVDGGEITVTRGSGDSPVAMTTAMVTGYNPTNIGSQVLTITYGGLSKTYNVDVVDSVTDVILTAPTKTTYEYGEELDLAGATVKTIMGSGVAIAPIQVTSSMISGYNKNQCGAQTITVTYNGIAKTFAVNVVDNIQSITMKTNPTKTTYKYNEQISVSGAKITVTRSSGATEDVDVTNSMITGYDATVLGSKTITVTYSGKTTTFNVIVEDYVSDILLINPTKTTYKLNETIDLTGGKVTKVMASGAAGTTVDMIASMISGFDTSAEGTKTVTVSYSGFTKTFPIVINDAATGISIVAPTKTSYKFGEELDLTGATVKIEKESGAETAPVSITAAMISGYNKNKLGDQTVTVTYEGLSKTFLVTVVDWDKELRIVKEPKKVYEYDEELDVEGGKVAIYTASGKVSSVMDDGLPIDMTASMVSGFDNKVEGTQALTVTWGGFTATYYIDLYDTVKAISMAVNLNKTQYAYGSPLDVTGAKIKVVKTSGEYTIDVIDSMVSGYDPKKQGEQAVTVTYGGKTTNFLVVVGNKPAEISKPVYNNTTTTQEPVVEEPTPVVEEPVVDNTDKNEPVKQEDKPTATLGSQDKKQMSTEEIILISIAGVSMLVAIALLIGLKRNNAEVYVIVNGKAQYAGRGKIDLETRYIDIEKCIENYDDDVIVRLIISEKVAEKLETKDIRVRARNKTLTCKVSKENNRYVINVQ